MGRFIARWLASILFLLLPAPAGLWANDHSTERNSMVQYQIIDNGIHDLRVINAMRTVPRHKFVLPSTMQSAYDDTPLPIGEGQTISQPYMVAFMSTLMELKGDERVLEIGTGSGYQAAILSRLCREVYTIEIKPVLHKRSNIRFMEDGYKNIHTRMGDGYYGWEEKGPFDAIMITAAANHIPPPLIKQLKDGGKLILPLSRSFFFQTLAIVTKKGSQVEIRYSLPVRFVPMTGRAMK